MQRLYIHVPFCAKKCGYCAFYSEPNPQPEQITGYFDRLAVEFAEQAPKCQELTSIYIGGGTPSLLSCDELTRLFGMISANFAIAGDAEISMECNPESLNAEKIPVICGFANRISLGIQSFESEFRQTISRSGDVADISGVLELLTVNGMENIGCDLIYAIPGEDLADWKKELQQAVSLPIQHISAYSLTYEEGTRLYQGQKLLDNDEHLKNEVAMWELAGEFLHSQGFERYEVSNYAQPGYECQHNNRIWFGATYLGCGPAAASFDGCDRWTNPGSLTDWIDSVKADIDHISPEKRAKEILVMGLRTTPGWDLKFFHDKTGFDCRKWFQELQSMIDNGFINVDENRICCSQKGLLFWNEIAESLF